MNEEEKKIAEAKAAEEAKAKEFVENIVTEKSKEGADQVKALEAKTAEAEEKVKALEAEITAIKKLPAFSLDVKSNDDRQCGFKSHVEFLAAVKAGPGSEPMKAYAQKAAGDPTLQGNVLADGGYIIYPPAYSTQLMDLAKEKADFFGKCSNVPVSGKTAELPYINGYDESGGTYYGGVKFYWKNELAQLTATKPAFDEMKLELHNITGLCYDSIQLEDDSPIASMIPVMFPNAMAQALDESFLHGPGTDQPQGIMEATALITIAKETSQVADSILSENIDKMIARAYRGGGGLTWVINPDCYPEIVNLTRVIKNVAGTDNVGGSVAMLYNAGSDTLAGRPVIWSDHTMTLGDKGDILLVDFSQYITITKAGQGMKMDMSIHIKFDYAQNCWRFIYRIDGQSGWASAMTPRRSSATRSPFVALAARA